jgi:predicted nucleotidyltransferase
MPKPDPNASDWSDLDLLTVSEATERLDEEVAAVRAEVDALAEDPARATELTKAQHRLVLLERARIRAAKTSVVITPGRVRSLAEVAETPGPPDWD